MNDAKTQALYSEMSVLADRIAAMMNEFPSEYCDAKIKVKESRDTMYANPKKAVKLLRKALFETENEYKVLKEFDRIASTFTVNERFDSKSEFSVKKAEFDKLVKKGKFKNAKKVLKQIDRLSREHKQYNAIKLDCIDNVIRDGKIVLLVDSTAETDLIIDNITVTSSDAVINAVVCPVKVLKANSQMPIDVSFASLSRDTVVLTVIIAYKRELDLYKERMAVKVYSKDLSELRE